MREAHAQVKKRDPKVFFQLHKRRFSWPGLVVHVCIPCNVCVCVSECHKCSVGPDSGQSRKPDEGTGSPGAGVSGGGESPGVAALRTKLIHLQKQQAFLSAEPPVRSPSLCYLLMKHVHNPGLHWPSLHTFTGLGKVN